jgi:hypothetical protein
MSANLQAQGRKGAKRQNTLVLPLTSIRVCRARVRGQRQYKTTGIARSSCGTYRETGIQGACHAVEPRRNG